MEFRQKMLTIIFYVINTQLLVRYPGERAGGSGKEGSDDRDDSKDEGDKPQDGEKQSSPHREGERDDSSLFNELEKRFKEIDDRKSFLLFFLENRTQKVFY